MCLLANLVLYNKSIVLDFFGTGLLCWLSKPLLDLLEGPNLLGTTSATLFDLINNLKFKLRECLHLL